MKKNIKGIVQVLNLISDVKIEKRIELFKHWRKITYKN
jgi:hypothetical protein